MTLHIIKEPDIYITESEYEKLRPEWDASQLYTTRPVSFEAFVRARKSQPSKG